MRHLPTFRTRTAHFGFVSSVLTPFAKTVDAKDVLATLQKSKLTMLRFDLFMYGIHTNSTYKSFAIAGKQIWFMWVFTTTVAHCGTATVGKSTGQFWLVGIKRIFQNLLWRHMQISLNKGKSACELKQHQSIKFSPAFRILATASQMVPTNATIDFDTNGAVVSKFALVLQTSATCVKPCESRRKI